MTVQKTATGITRRGFLKTTGAVAGAAALQPTAAPLLTALAEQPEAGPEGEQLFNCICRSNCMGACRLTAHVRDGKIYKLEPADYPDEGYTGCCLKGLTYIERMYSPERVQYPMRRAGERGAGEWERVSWDDAIAEIAQRFNATVEEYGPQALVFDSASGNYGYINGIYGLYPRICANLGATKTASSYDLNAGPGVNRVLGTGDWAYCNEPNSVLDSSMIVIWGTNPVLTMPHNWRWIQWAKEKGAHVVAIDIMQSATAHRCDETILVNPGHDGYLALAMSNYIVENDLVDWDFLRDRGDAAYLVRADTGAFLRKSDYEPAPTVEGGATEEEVAAWHDDFYVWDNASGGIALVADAVDPAFEGTFATEDGVEVTTAFSLLKEQLSQYTLEEASRLCGPAPEAIAEFAERFAAEEAVSVNITYGIDHYVNGYQNCWAVAVLMALTGNYAAPGKGFIGVFTNAWVPNYLGMWVGEEFKGLSVNIPTALLPDIFATQELEGQPFPMRSMISYGSNPLGNMASQREWLDKIMPNLDTWVVVDSEMNDSARYADFVLPPAMWYEVEELRANYQNPYAVYQEKCVEPLYESKPDFEIASLLGRAMGFEKSFPEGWGFEEWANILLSDAKATANGWTLEKFREEQVIQSMGVPGEPFIRGLTIPFPTEDGRAHLYCEKPAPRCNWGQDLTERLPKEHIVYYEPPAEAGVDDPLAEKYPFTFCQEHARWRVHTQWYNVPTLRELDREPLCKINEVDAVAKGVATGDVVKVFNDRGSCTLKALVDNSVAPGQVLIPKGWAREQFIDGCYQELTQPKTDAMSTAFAYYDTRVDFEKA